MALNLDHFKLSEDPNLFYRRVGMPAVNDFLTKGQIAGSQNYGGQAYFLRGAEWSTGGAPYRITANMSMLNPASNPLYGDLGNNRYLTQAGAFPLGRTAGASGQYPILNPNTTPSFWDTVNPKNRAGIKIDDTRTGKVFYDRTKPILRTPIATTLKNAVVEAGITGRAILPYAGTVSNYAGIIPIVTSELERKRSDYQDPITQKYYTKDKVINMDGLIYDKSDAEMIAKFHPDNADRHPEITDEMRKKFHPKWFKK